MILWWTSGLLGAAVIFWACQSSAGEKGPGAPSREALVKRGAYLVNIMGCNDCHTPKIMTATGPVPDSNRLLSGHRAETALPAVYREALQKGWALFYSEGTAAVTPAGTAYAANLTPDETGIGNWTEAQFRTALTRGKWKGLENARGLMPPMPWENYRELSEEDIHALYTYLRSIPAVDNLVPAALPAAQPDKVPRLTAADY